jgi:osmotically-inducible protein OsmY
MFRLAATSSRSRTPLARIASERLRESSHRSLWNVSCDDREGSLILRGRVASYHVKQLAQEIVSRIDGVEEIVNRLEVPDTLPSLETADAADRSARFRPR